jgi:putative transposase
MKHGRFREERIVAILKEADGGRQSSRALQAARDFRRHILELAQQVRGLEVSDLRRQRQLEEKNRRLKSIVADQALDRRALKDVLVKNGYGPR